MKKTLSFILLFSCGFAAFAQTDIDVKAKVAIIKNGRLIAVGPTEEIRGSASLEDVFLELEEN